MSWRALMGLGREASSQYPHNPQKAGQDQTFAICTNIADVSVLPGAAKRPTHAYHLDIETEWPEDYRREYPLLVESFRRAGHSKQAAELLAYLDWTEDARRFAHDDER